MSINKLDFGKNEVDFFKIFQEFKLILESLNCCDVAIPYELKRSDDCVEIVFSDKSLHLLLSSLDKYNRLFVTQYKEITELANRLFEIAESASERPDPCMREESVDILGEMFVLNPFSIKHVFMFPYISYVRFNISKYRDLLGGLTESFDVDLSRRVVSHTQVRYVRKNYIFFKFIFTKLKNVFMILTKVRFIKNF